MIEAVPETRNRCASAALTRSGAEKDLAHKIAEDIRRSSEILITNLSSLL